METLNSPTSKEQQDEISILLYSEEIRSMSRGCNHLSKGQWSILQTLHKSQ